MAASGFGMKLLSVAGSIYARTQAASIAGELLPLREISFRSSKRDILRAIDEVTDEIPGVIYLDSLASFSEEQVRWFAEELLWSYRRPLAVIADTTIPDHGRRVETKHLLDLLGIACKKETDDVGCD